jgi:hypothetical protein
MTLLSALLGAAGVCDMAARDGVGFSTPRATTATSRVLKASAEVAGDSVLFGAWAVLGEA